VSLSEWCHFDSLKLVPKAVNAVNAAPEEPPPPLPGHALAEPPPPLRVPADAPAPDSHMRTPIVDGLAASFSALASSFA